MEPATLLETTDLACGYDRASPVLAGVTLAVAAGQTVVLVGASGCGKTTLLKTVCGLLPPISGRVIVGDRSAPKRPLAGQVGYVPQGLGLVQHATVLHNVLNGMLPENGLLRSLVGVFTPAQVQRAREALDRVGLGHKEADRPLHLSGGERRRVAIARTLAQRPALLLADEIVSELDEQTAQIVLHALDGFQRETDMGVLMVEHDLDRSCAIADVVCCLGSGGLLAVLTRGPGRAQRAREVMAGLAGAPTP